MGNVVTGLAQDTDTKALRAALDAAGLSHDPLQVITGDDAVQPVVRTLGIDDLIVGETGTGTGVPGITDSGSTGVGILGRGAFSRNEELADRLSDLHIPDSQMDNYLEALERGKTIVAYFAKPETVEAATGAFRTAALANVRVF